MSRLSLVERQFATFLRTPLSVRKAMAVIVTATVVSVVLGGVLIGLLTPRSSLMWEPVCGGRCRW
jgi:hypothetical protein